MQIFNNSLQRYLKKETSSIFVPFWLNRYKDLELCFICSRRKGLTLSNIGISLILPIVLGEVIFPLEIERLIDILSDKISPCISPNISPLRIPV
ncbi:MAG: hypothetical protein A3J96_01265 [Sulfurimonas sp. RIFOXYC2_FULL_36_7]|nr:MAG: hypothetical protein A3J96_01265 [Sulfurimonas sp. RIFOXYC2_FULL_36_7]